MKLTDPKVIVALEQGCTLRRRSEHGERIRVHCNDKQIFFLVEEAGGLNSIGEKFRPHYLLLDDWEVAR